MKDTMPTCVKTTVSIGTSVLLEVMTRYVTSWEKTIESHGKRLLSLKEAFQATDATASSSQENGSNTPT